jgi:hypothetical protein
VGESLPAFFTNMDYFSSDKITGTTEYFDFDEQTGIATIRTEQEESGLLDYTAYLRNEKVRDKGIKSGWWQFAIIPPVVVMQLKNKGIDVFDRNDWGRLTQEIETNYPYLKTTEKTHVERHW